MAGAAIVLAAVTIALIVPSVATPTSVPFGTYGVLTLVGAVTYPIVGWLVASRRPENPIGWILLLEGLLDALMAFSSQYSTYGLINAPGSLPFADVASWVAGWIWASGTVLFFLLVLVFPDGRLPSPRWRPVLLLGVVAFILETVPNAIALWSYRGPALLAANTPDTSTSGPAIQLALAIGGISSLAFAIVAVISIVVRFRRSSGIERQQIKWFGAAGIVTITLLWLVPVIALPVPFDALAALVVGPLLPGAIAIAILRYRLYEIDRIVSRTISYLIITGFLAVVFVGAVFLLQAVLTPVVGENPVAVAASTLVVAALFKPSRTRVQQIVDRRFNRARYNAERTAAAFAARLRDQVELAELRADLLSTVTGALDPSGAGVWIRDREAGRS
jgi:hypothetical protein